VVDRRPANPIELCSLTVRQADLLELVDVAARAGFDRVTVTPHHVIASGQDLARLRARCDDAGVAIGYLDGLGRGLPGITRGESPDEVFDMAEGLGVALVNVVHYGGDPEVPVEMMIDALGALTERAATRGLRLVVEFIPGTAIPDLPTALELVRAVASDHLRVLLDTWHLGRSGGGPDLVVGDVPGLIGALQVSDRRRAQDLEPYVPMSGRLLPGHGELALRDVLGPIVAAQPSLAVGVEVANDDLLAMPPAAAAVVAADAIREVLSAIDLR
jgi:sugar phosphate isomerase/epimerase